MKLLCVIITVFVIITIQGCSSDKSTYNHQINSTEADNIYIEETDNNTNTELYSIDDFDSVIIGKTTYSELCEMIGVPSEGIYALSYGGGCVYYLEDGRYVFIVIGYEESVVIKFKICENNPVE